MRDFFRYYLFERRIAFTKTWNGWLYFLRKLPLIGKRLPTSPYRWYGVKNFLGSVSNILRFVWTPLKKLLWLTGYYALASFITSVASGRPFLTVFTAFEQPTIWLASLAWLVFVLLWYQIPFSLWQVLDQKELDTMLSFQLSRRLFVYGRLYVDLLWDWLCYSQLIVIGLVIGQPFLGVTLFLAYGILRLAGDMFRRFSFKYQLRKSVKRVCSLFYFMGTVAFAAGMSYLILTNQPPFFATIWGLIPLLLLVGSYGLLLRHFPEEAYLYQLVASAITNFTDESTVSGNEFVQEGLAMQEALQLTPLRTEKLAGTEYLNALLFSRYRSLLNRAFRIRATIIGAVGLLIVLVLVVTREAIPEKLILTLIPVLFFIMYLLSFGKKIVQMVFVNCDISMLYYPFYRQPQTILNGFWYRLKETLRYNGLLALEIFVIYLLVAAVQGFPYSLGITALILLNQVSLTLLFSFHELFVYYLLQPFTGDMQVVNPAYKFISGAFYWLAYMNTRLNIASIYYVLLISFVSLLYVGIGLLVIRKKAPQTFRIKD
ncbi:hypothetical protein [Enterococcus canis]|uniref:hypothetical protein n=1 Tax=Enterococcus canis TaxID=214095 RepID=UPI00082E0239|nr:hypothetical protein [Enterococcus canis]